MAFLFKSKKNQDRALASRDGPPSSGGSSIQSAAARVREEKGSRSTPTGSLNSLDNEGSMGSPDQNYARQRGQSLEQTPALVQPSQQTSSDLPVSPRSRVRHLGPPQSESQTLVMLTSCVDSSAMALAPSHRRKIQTPRSTPGRSGD